MQNVSIDINVNKLLEWLISRRHCQKDWQKDISLIREKINLALLDMPEHKQITNLLAGSYINYFHCLEIIKILHETEADSKNIFGRYSSKRMKDWNEIVSLYHRNDVYLAEAADILITAVKYDVPNLKKQVTKQKHLENELKKKEADAVKAGISMKNELTGLLKELGLKDCKPGKYKSGLLETAKGLSSTHDKIANKTNEILPSIDHYKEFSKITQPHLEVDMAVITYLREKGNTTLYEYLKGEKPSSVILPEISCAEDDNDGDDGGIDWGYPTEEVAPAEPEVPDDPTVATGDLAYSVLDSKKTRESFVNSLLELRSFLKLRLLESELDTGLGSVNVSASSLQKMLNDVDSIIKLLNSPTVQHQYYLTHSVKYLEDILKKIEQKESLIDRYAAVVDVSKERAKEAAAETVKYNSEIKVHTAKCQELQNKIVAEISKKYSGRPVYLVGAF